MRFNQKEIAAILINQANHFYLDNNYLKLISKELNIFLNLVQQMKKLNEDLICGYVKEDICDIETNKLEIEKILLILNKYKKILKIIIKKIDKIVLYLDFITVNNKSLDNTKNLLDKILNVFMELILVQENFLFLLGENKKFLNSEITELKKIFNYINKNFEQNFEIIIDNFDYFDFVFDHKFFKLLKKFNKKLKEL